MKEGRGTLPLRHPESDRAVPIDPRGGGVPPPFIPLPSLHTAENIFSPAR